MASMQIGDVQTSYKTDALKLPPLGRIFENNTNEGAHLLDGYGPNGCHLRARRLLLNKLAGAQLLDYRKVCLSWRTEINALLTVVKSLKLFSDREAARVYKRFIEEGKLNNLEHFKISTYQFDHLELIVNDIDKLMSSTLLPRFSGIKQLTLFGRVAKWPGAPLKRGSFHPFLLPMLRLWPKVDTLVFYGIGLPVSTNFNDPRLKALTDIFLIQPSEAIFRGFHSGTGGNLSALNSHYDSEVCYRAPEAQVSTDNLPTREQIAYGPHETRETGKTMVRLYQLFRFVGPHP